MAIRSILVEQADFTPGKPKEMMNVIAHNLGYRYYMDTVQEFIVDYFHGRLQSNDVREPFHKWRFLVVVNDENLLKVHVHTNQPGVALTLAQKFGELKTIKIDNMRIQHTNITGQDHHHFHEEAALAEEAKPKVKYGIIAVAQGTGIKETFKELGVDYVIDGDKLEPTN